MVRPVRLSGVRPLVRYVDEEQAVIDAFLFATPSLPDFDSDTPATPTIDVMLEVTGSDGFHDEGETRVRLVNGRASMRFDLVQPQRWWPAGMGEQPLYSLTARVVNRDDIVAEQTVTFGLASVRRDRPSDAASRDLALLIHGQVCRIRSVLSVDRVDEHSLLPASGETLLLVRDHYGPDLLYDAADRAGILLIQCVPISPDGTPEVDVEAQVSRLATHPSLAGWFVGHLGGLSDEVATRIRHLDPGRTVFRDFPVYTPAA